MGFSCGIVGLPNVGKSTICNALSNEQNAKAANYPFCTIEPNKAIVPVPDRRVDVLSKIVNTQKVIYTTMEFLDIAGLVKGASTGEGLGNQFLANIRETEAILHVVRCFDDDDVIHVDGSVDPVRDVEIIELELVMADEQTIEKAIMGLAKKARIDKKIAAMVDEAKGLLEHLKAGEPASSYANRDADTMVEFYKQVRPLSAKDVIYVANVDEDAVSEDNAYVTALKEYAASKGRDVISICAKMEEDMAGLSDEERHEFLKEYGVDESGLEKVIHAGYRTLGLVSYFTAGDIEARAWTIHQGWTAPQAAGVIHTDFERGFIKAEIVGYDAYVKHGGESGAKAAGELRIEGKDYVVQDGDVIHFRFNV
ncbi:MAG: redox-regulated ATPase YchF [Phycisphaerales bacterium]|jgi:ribosome-binding ATPase|nr:redox-regulated ATPase YchF [Phycisphaerales bacterium]MBT7170147.1 redox-regulated ATPase YchF [Phycisphaerales bacterium]